MLHRILPLCAISLLLLLRNTESTGQYKDPAGSPTLWNLFHENNPYNTIGEPYFTIGAGMAVWSRSNQEGFEKDRLPYHLLLEYGKTRHPLSVVFGANVLGNYQYDIFQINPNHFYTGFQFMPFRREENLENVDLYILAGGLLNYCRFTEDSYDAVQGYTHKVESKINPAFTAGAGMGLHFGNYELRALFQWYGGEASFLAGHFDRIPYGTGAYQAQLLLLYRFNLTPSRNLCPVYK